MFVQSRRMIVTEDHADELVERFSKAGILEEQEGFIDSTVMVKKANRGDEEVMVLVRWESEQNCKEWQKSEVHIAGHKAKLGKPKPDYLIHTEFSSYEIKSIKKRP
ncbi:antibiotic biosynthesis monooxygenase [Paenibacillus agricola]|uniref:antibiotic biosynthesis monooxygenase n=1 Tax=Paenibacillus agricola TaxID=2716264 RepID=UPI001A9E592D|nr:antibiotic biosynthesis monooxygenase [Paenibacillus agricola]